MMRIGRALSGCLQLVLLTGVVAYMGRPALADPNDTAAGTPKLPTLQAKPAIPNLRVKPELEKRGVATPKKGRKALAQGPNLGQGGGPGDKDAKRPGPKRPDRDKIREEFQRKARERAERRRADRDKKRDQNRPKPGGAGKGRNRKGNDDDKDDKPDKSADPPVPKWRQGEESEEEDSEPTLSKDFIKHCQPLRPGVKVQLDIMDEELDAVVKLMACMTSKNIILPKSLKGKKITIYSPAKVTANEAYRAFLTAMHANGYTFSRSGKFLKIIEVKDSARHPDPILDESSVPANEDRMVTQILPLEHVDAQEINEVVRQLASQSAQFIIYAPTNTLIITEVSSNLRKLLGLIKQLDVPSGRERLWVYQVQFADAPDIVAKVLEIFDQQDQRGKGSSRMPKARSSSRRKGKNPKTTVTSVGESDQDVHIGKMVADERTNRILVVANEKSYRRVKDLIRKLDVEIPGDGQIHIHQLNHAKAADLANVLSQLSRENRSGGRTSRGRKSSSKKSSKSKKSSSSSGAALFEGEVVITADEDTNALVITANLKDYLSLKQVIDALDRVRRQVFVEAVIMEVSIDNDRQFGIAFHGGVADYEIGGKASPIIIGSQPGELNSLTLNPSILTGLAAVTMGPRDDAITDNFGLDVPSFGAVMRALASSNDVNILSTPHILTTDNEEAEIVVGQNVPFVSGIMGGGMGGGLGRSGVGGMGGFGFPSVSVQRQDVALTLKLTPRINAANFVTLEVDQTIEELGAIDPVKGPTTTKRSLKSTVVVKDQQTVVVGGLQRSSQTKSATKVPIIGEIPVLGYLFRDSKKTASKQNLLLMLTPHVVESPADFREIFKRKLDEHREFVARFHKEGDQLVLGIDYGKKHGALEAINQSLRGATEENQLLEELLEQQEGPPLPQEVDGVYFDDPDPGQAPPPPPPAAGDASSNSPATVPVDGPEPPEFVDAATP